jgi:hypothetical protein
MYDYVTVRFKNTGRDDGLAAQTPSSAPAPRNLPQSHGARAEQTATNHAPTAATLEGCVHAGGGRHATV